jgi:hypothetical protein
MDVLLLVLVVVSVFVFLASRFFWKKSFQHKTKLSRIGFAALSALALVLGGHLLMLSGYAFWYTHRPIPAELHETLFQGITYTREVRSQPRPLVIDVVSIDLNAPGLRFLVTPGQPTDGRQLPSRTTSQFLSEFNLQLAINGDCCLDWFSRGPFDYFPHSGEGVNVMGFASSDGKIYSSRRRYPSLYISADNKASFGQPIGSVYNAVSGLFMIIQNGKIRDDVYSPFHNDLYTQQPRTAYAIDKDATHLLLFNIDGRQPSYSEGVTIAELIDIVLQYGGYTAMNVDGGGSSTLVIQDTTGWPIVLNSPIDSYIPGRERPIGNHLGVYANRP